MTIPQSVYSVDYGSSVTIPCRVSADPGATSISWQRTSGSVTKNLDIPNIPRYGGGTVASPSLTITNAQLGDEGDYRCSATNSIGSGQSGLASLDVVGSMFKLDMIASVQIFFRISSSCKKIVCFLKLIL